MARELKPRLARKTAKAAPKKPAAGMPSRDEVLEFIANSEEKVGKREIAKAFQLKGADRIPLKAMLKELADNGLLTHARKGIRKRGELGATAVVDITGRDQHGELIGEPAAWDREEDGEPPRVLVLAPREGGEAVVLGMGDRALMAIEAVEAADDESHSYTGRPIRKLVKEKKRLIGIFEAHGRGGGAIKPIDKKVLKDWRIEPGDEGGARTGELVRFDIERRGRTMFPTARIVERLGNPADERLTSLIAIASFDIPNEFPQRVLDEVKTLPRIDMKGRTDLRKIPLITIDPVDARDHDDAVFAEPDPDPKNPGGFIVLVAIADVAAYVRPGTGLDREAWKRGNSVYFPDRVVPMLPEDISNGVCSLKEKEDRPCLAVRMVFDKNGKKQKHEFLRGMMRSAAKLAYEEAQAAIDGKPGDKAGPLVEPILKPLYAAYKILSKARDERQPLDLNLPERKIRVGADGRVAKIEVPERLDAHRLIEEMMIQANVAAAETLEQKRTPLLYRAHAEPGKEKLKGLRDFLETVEMSLPKAGQIKPEHLNRILEKTKGSEVADLVNEVMLRSQSQAEYTHENYGHFGLNLMRYAHFTSPIRRYADLVVHRALIRALGFGGDGLSDDEVGRLPATATHISETERRAMAAERETSDRLIAQHLSTKIGVEFAARVSGLIKSGLFVRLDETGADGFIPASTLGREYFRYDDQQHAMVGEQSGASFRLGDKVDVRLAEAIPTAGALRFEMVSEGSTGKVTGPRRPVRGPIRKGSAKRRR